MSTVWVSGGSIYEITGVEYLLSGLGISACVFRAGNRLREGDSLILCLSSLPLLGWARYLKIIHWISHRYAVRMIILCPGEVYRTGIVCSQNTVVVNGEYQPAQLSLLLMQSVQYCLQPESDWHGSQPCTCSLFWDRAFRALLISATAAPDRSAAKKAYRQRDLIVQRLAFTSLMKLKVVMAGQKSGCTLCRRDFSGGCSVIQQNLATD